MSDDVLPFPGPQAPEHLGLVPVIEALLFVAGEPVSVDTLSRCLDDAPVAEVKLALRALDQRMQHSGSGLRLVQVAGGWQLKTQPAFATPVRELVGGRPTKLSRAALEVLAVVAYQQPATRMEIEDIRGVSSGAVVKQLLERGLLRVGGRRDVPGRPLEYSTTRAFLELFELSRLRDLPTLAERESLEDG